MIVCEFCTQRLVAKSWFGRANCALTRVELRLSLPCLGSKCYYLTTVHFGSHWMKATWILIFKPIMLELPDRLGLRVQGAGHHERGFQMKNYASAFGRQAVRLLATFGLLGLLAIFSPVQAAVTISPGFNLLGNSNADPIAVATAFGDATLYTSVWKWDASKSQWAFYTPALADGGLAYGQTKGYQPLTTINAGEGFWVNAKSGGSVALLSGAPVTTSSSASTWKNGFNLISIGDAYTPVQFAAALGALNVAPPTPGVSVLALTTLWAWDPLQLKWYFYAPSLDQASTLASFIQSKGYLDFALLGKTLDSGTGFWVNVGANASVNTAPPNVTSGVITGFVGGIQVNGQPFPDGRAGYDRMGEHSDADSVSAGQAQLGQEVLIEADASGNAIAVHIHPGLIGPVDAVPPTSPANQISVNGVAVQVNTDATLGTVTVFGGYTGIADIKVGDRVEVHGVRQTDTLGKIYIAATRIELKPSICTPSPCAVRVSGNLSQLDAVSFKLDGLTVNYADAKLLPSGAKLVEGEWVSVLANAVPVSGVLTAAAVKVRSLATTATSLSVSGPISNYQSVESFMVNGIMVNASKLSPAPATLANGQPVNVQGTFDPATNTLLAAALTPMQSKGAAVEGLIVNFVSAANFMVRNVLVDASKANFVNGDASKLQNSAEVEVKGALVGGTLVASSVAFQSIHAGVMQVFPGQVANYVVATGTFDLTLPGGKVLSATLANPEFLGGTLADFANGVNVLVTGSLANGVLTVHGIQYLLTQQLVNPVGGVSGEVESKQLGGIARDVVPTKDGVTFKLNGLSVNYVGDLKGLANGMPVQLTGTLSGSTVTAGKIKLQD